MLILVLAVLGGFIQAHHSDWDCLGSVLLSCRPTAIVVDAGPLVSPPVRSRSELLRQCYTQFPGGDSVASILWQSECENRVRQQRD